MDPKSKRQKREGQAMRVTCFLVTVVVLCVTIPILAQSNIDPVHKVCWGENIGWTNWRDAGATEDGVVVDLDFLSGFIWAENVGWMNIGDGDGPYANSDDSDFGVNVLPSGDLVGLAWGENIGWINLEGGALADPPNPARFDFTAGRFRGYAWGENVGWINLDDATYYVAARVLPPGDCDGDHRLDLHDVAHFQNCFTGATGESTLPGCACVDLDRDSDIYLNDWKLLLQVITGP